MPHAKINLLLSVGAPLPEGDPHAGYHPILSWFHAIDLRDDLSLERAASTSFHIEWSPDAPRPSPIDWPAEKDLTLRALRALEAHAGKALPTRITLRKRIPVGAGLGGGSSDAGAALLALRSLHALEIGDDALVAIGASLGSDVPFFVDPALAGEDALTHPPAPALVRGLGEQVERTDALADPLLLVIPSFGCSTPEVYRAFDALLAERAQSEERERFMRDLTGPRKQTAPRENLVLGRLQRMLSRGSLDEELLLNDLTIPAFRVAPALGALATSLSNACRSRAHLTGSGSTLVLTSPPAKFERLVERALRCVQDLPADVRPVLVTSRLVGGRTDDAA